MTPEHSPEPPEKRDKKDPLLQEMISVEAGRVDLVRFARGYALEQSDETEGYLDNALETLEECHERLVEVISESEDFDTEEKINWVNTLRKSELISVVSVLRECSGDHDEFDDPEDFELELISEDDDEKGLLEEASSDYGDELEQNIKLFKFILKDDKRQLTPKEELIIRAKDVATISTGVVVGGLILSAVKSLKRR